MINSNLIRKISIGFFYIRNIYKAFNRDYYKNKKKIDNLICYNYHSFLLSHTLSNYFCYFKFLCFESSVSQRQCILQIKPLCLSFLHRKIFLEMRKLVLKTLIHAHLDEYGFVVWCLYFDYFLSSKKQYWLVFSTSYIC